MPQPFVVVTRYQGPKSVVRNVYGPYTTRGEARAQKDQFMNQAVNKEAIRDGKLEISVVKMAGA